MLVELNNNIPLATKPVVIPSFNLVWYLIPKVASTSIKKMTEQWNRSFVSREEVQKKYKDYISVTIVRNPFDRLVSCWSNKTQDEAGYKTWCKRYEQHLPVYYKMPFEEFAYNVCSLPDDISDRHYRSQVLQLEYENKFLPDYIGKLETLNDSLADITELTNMPTKIVSHVYNKSKHKPYQDYYSEDLKKAVAKKFERDLDILQYTF